MVKYIAIAVVALLVCLSCCTTTGGDGDGNGDEQATVLGTLNLFLQVWNDGDVDTYEGLLDEDDFTFYFDPSDVGGGGGDIPISWGFDEEITAYTNLFDAVGDGNIDVELDFSDVTEPADGVDIYKVEEIPYSLRVVTEELILLGEAHLDIQLEKMDGEWFITDWWDRISWRLPCGEECSWGAIKAYYYY